MKDKDELNLKNRFLELARNCYFKDLPIHTLFLNLHEQTIFHSMIKELPKIKHIIFGGYEFSERKIVCFVPYYLEEISFDMLAVLKIEACNEKFSNELKHRDFLGAILNLGLERNVIGDIIVKDNKAYIIILNKVKDIIMDNLLFIKKTKVKISVADFKNLSLLENTKELNINVASLRLDVFIASVFNKSRSKVSEYIMSNLVFINGKESTNHSYNIKENDIISVRGLGRFKFLCIENKTRKARLLAKVLIYI